MKKLIASCFTEIFFLSLFFFFWKLRHRFTADSKQRYVKLLVQDITTQFRLFSSPSTSLFILIQDFNKGDNPGDSWNDQIFCVPLLCSSDRFPLAGTHFRTGDSSVVYIFYGLWALSSTEVRLGVIVFPLCEVSGGENWKIQQKFCAQPRHAPLSLCGGDRTVGMGGENNSRRTRYLWDLSLPHVASKSWNMYILLTRVSLDWKKQF